jgi:hypothetical protein
MAAFSAIGRCNIANLKSLDKLLTSHLAIQYGHFLSYRGQS